MGDITVLWTSRDILILIILKTDPHDIKHFAVRRGMKPVYQTLGGGDAADKRALFSLHVLRYAS